MPSLVDILRQVGPGLGLASGVSTKEELERSFYCEFGKFICRFSGAETAVHRMFRRVTGLNGDKARAIVAGKEIAIMMEITKRVANLLPSSRFSKANKKELEVLFQQLSIISTFRNSLIHGGADVENDGTLRTVNYNKAKTLRTVQEITFGISDVQAATDDINSITLRIYHLVKADSWTRKRIPKMRREPWRYKSLPTKSWWGRLLADELMRSPQLRRNLLVAHGPT